jgi:hypothetical protein
VALWEPLKHRFCEQIESDEQNDMAPSVSSVNGKLGGGATVKIAIPEEKECTRLHITAQVSMLLERKLGERSSMSPVEVHLSRDVPCCHQHLRIMDAFSWILQLWHRSHSEDLCELKVTSNCKIFLDSIHVFKANIHIRIIA